MASKPRGKPAQKQDAQPGKEEEMAPRPRVAIPEYRGSAKLKGKVALITGGDSGIGRATAVLFAREGADVCITYLNEHKDAEQAKKLVEKEGQRCLQIPGDIGVEQHCIECVEKTVAELGRLDILVNNAAEQHPKDDLQKITDEQLQRTFRTNIFAQFYFAKAALRHFKEGSVIINTTSVTAYRGSPHLLDYASTKGAIVSFTRSLAKALADRGIRVNGVAPGPIWTPLIPATFPPDEVAEFGTDVPLKRPGEPMEVAPCFVFLASSDSSYMSGQILHPNGGEVVNG
jgi:NAD(P)-dependent dehydrogenase (short-subunit alcohol dehydrogenase family)